MNVYIFFGSLISFYIFFFVFNAVVKAFYKTKNKKQERPSEITTLVLILFCGLIYSLLSILSKLSISNAFEALIQLSLIIWLAGLWKMKKYGVWGYTFFIFLIQLNAFLNNTWNFSLLIPLIILPIFAKYYSQMK